MNTQLIQENQPKLCLYYLVRVERARAWFMAAVMRGTEHVCFDRALDKKENIFEFFVPHATESIFLELIAYLEKEGVVLEWHKQENRFLSN